MGVPFYYSAEPAYNFNITEQDIRKAYQPYFYTFRPTVATPAGGIDVVFNNITYRDFIWTHLGWTTDAPFAPVITMPNIGVPFRVRVRDINAGLEFANQRFDLTSITGTNPQWHDKPMFKLAVPWRFLMNTRIEVEVENIGLVAAFLTVTLHGFYDNKAMR